MYSYDLGHRYQFISNRLLFDIYPGLHLLLLITRKAAVPPIRITTVTKAIISANGNCGVVVVLEVDALELVDVCEDEEDD